MKSGAVNNGFELQRNPRFYFGVIAVLCFLLYGNTLTNLYSLDDHLVTNHNELIGKGISAIPEIFTTNYIAEDSVYLDYRPLVKTTYAIEYSLFDWNPKVSHFFNILLYTLGCCLLLKLLLVVFKTEVKDKKVFTIILAGVILYIAHPVHTEVVASLKNRDEILVLIFICLSALVFIKYADTGKVNYLVGGTAIFLCALLSKISCIPYIASIPLMLYFYNSDWKKSLTVLASLAVLTIGYYVILIISLPGLARPYSYEETPLPYMDKGTAIGTGLYSLLYYLKLLIAPVKLSFYYGINYVKTQSLFSPFAIISLVLHAGILGAAVYTFKRNKIVSFFLLFYLIQISLYSNIVLPLAGIVAERGLFFASISFTVLLALAIGLLNKTTAKPNEKKETESHTLSLSYPSLILLVLVLTGYSFMTINRNSDWYDTITLFEADMPHLQESAKANYTTAKEVKRLYRTDKSMPTDSAMAMADKAIGYYKNALVAYPNYAIAAEELGMTYAIDLGQVDSGIIYFNRALSLDSTLWRSAYNMGFAYELKKDTLAAIRSFEQALKLQPKSAKSMNELVKLYYFTGNKRQALATNDKLAALEPESFVPYFNYSQYYLAEKDTVKAVTYLEETVKRRAPDKGVYIFLFRYYATHGDTARAAYYQNIISRFSPQKR